MLHQNAAVPRFEPFAGIRYAPAIDLDAVTAPPYDVMSLAERDAFAAKHPANAVTFDAPTASGDPYGEAARILDSLLADGTLVIDAPSLYLYRMTNAGRHTTGVIGALGLERPGEGDVLPHEHTTKKAKSDRLDLLRATHANLSPIWGLSLAKGLAELCEPPAASTPDGRATDDEGVVHELWRIEDPARIAAIVERVESEPVVIADGHHRYETCLAYREERGPEPGGYDLTMMFVVELTDDELDVQPIHRLLHGAPVEKIAAQMAERLDRGDGITLVGPDRTWTFAPRADGPDLDTEQVAQALEGIAGLEIGYQHGDVAAIVAAGGADAAVIMRPVSVATIRDVANRRDRMPPKTTFFHPKPRTGFVLRSLD
ncbi:MAG: hypothetical protein QOI47_2012 [Actinomycetota bacterium]|jgi:uncharacterized protein (DUF1015 family)|nr:hypothetical protein [Actinomycetota bacterium]